MELELEGDETPPPAPKGYTIRPVDLQADAGDLYVVNEVAFSGNADYEPESEAHFRDEHLRGHNLRPELSLVATREHRLAGFAIVRDHGNRVAYVDLLAVHPDHAGRGLGSALLRGAFAVAARAGFRSGRLGVASDNPNAIRLYARAGMTQRWRTDSYSKAL
jgi:ribosomal protein S18 acetylase RimI-like enzyme